MALQAPLTQAMPPTNPTVFGGMDVQIHDLVSRAAQRCTVVDVGVNGS
jgi:hypothetical protein